MNITRLGQALVYGKALAQKNAFDAKISWKKLYLKTIAASACKGIKPESYIQDKVYLLDKTERQEYYKAQKQLLVEEKKWNKLFYSNWRFLTRWSKEFYSGRQWLSYLRATAYMKHYHLKNRPAIQYGVQIICEHSMWGKLEIGKNVLLAKECFLDYTGDLIVKDNVQITYGVILQTHYHPFHSDYRQPHNAVPTQLVIEEGAVIGSKAIIMPSCHYIGKYARVGAGSVVTHDVPDYAIVVGSPAKIVRTQEHDEIQ
jgi:acetyltransferase-like isoleucine patch superfamily enzyme